jgi:hypothetical protein
MTTLRSAAEKDGKGLLAHPGDPEEEELAGEISVGVRRGQPVEDQLEEGFVVFGACSDGRLEVVHRRRRFARTLITGAAGTGAGIAFQAFQVVAHGGAGESGQRTSNAEQVGAGARVLPHMVGRRNSAHPDNDRARADRLAHLFDNAQPHRTHPIARETPPAVGQNRVFAMLRHGRADGVDQGEAGGARGHGRLGRLAGSRQHWRPLDENRKPGLARPRVGNLAAQVDVLAHSIPYPWACGQDMFSSNPSAAGARTRAACRKVSTSWP